MTPARYTVQRCTRKGTTYGPVHLSDHGSTTRCGWVVEPPYWWITANDGTGKATCKKCLSRAEPKGTDDP